MRVLFLCTGNSARSQMAEGFANHLGHDIAEFFSAGTVPGPAVNPDAKTAMLEKGIDISMHSPKAFESIVGPIDRIVTVCDEAAQSCPRPAGAVIESWSLEDPAAFVGSEEETLKVFRKSRDEIEQRVFDLLTRLKEDVHTPA